MKKVILFFVFAFATAMYAHAQGKNLGLGLAFGSEIEKPGLLLNGQFFVNDKIAISPSLIFYAPEKTETNSSLVNVKSSSFLWEINGDVNYYFNSSSVKFYGIAGLNIAIARGKYEATYPSFPANNIKSESSNSEFGLNIGVGADFKVSGSIVPFAQLKYTLSDYDQLVIMGGVRFPLGN